MTTPRPGPNARPHDTDRIVSALRSTLKENERLKERNRRLSESRSEPVAVVGIGCRFPGGVGSPEELWALVEAGGDGTSEFPADRGWDAVGRGAFLEEAAGFDAGFFGVSPREALAMDPQQRVVLETVWEALERAGIEPGSLRGSRTATYVGAIHQEYGPRMHEAAEETAGYTMTGTLSSVIAGRVAYVLGLGGAAVTLDTACSSSLVAVHEAVMALRRGECDLALAGGVTVMGSPGVFVEFARQGGLSPDGRCRSYGAGANGTGFGEGAGIVVLERLSDALERGRCVWGVVRGSAVNSDGASNGLAAPSGQAQEAVLRAALADAGVDASAVGVVEGHGTGTVLGDPVEAGALGAVYGRAGGVVVGSVKANIAHAQAAAGVAGLVNLVGIVGRGVIPAAVGAAEGVSPLVEWDRLGLDVATGGPRRWRAGEGLRIGAVSSFGISGTNAHLILEQPPRDARQPRAFADPAQPAVPAARADPRAVPHPRSGTAAAPAGTERGPGPVSDLVPWPVSARSEAALAEQARRLLAHLAARPDLSPHDVGFSLATTRTHFEHRAAVLPDAHGDHRPGLQALAEGRPAPTLVRGRADAPGKTVFVFPGQGAQWAGMAAGLLDASPVFAEAVAACERALAPHLDWPLADVLRGDPAAPALDRADIVQPALFAVMVALAELWRSCGVRPDAVIGHSQGEIAAAHVAGALTLDDAAHIVAARSRALRHLSGSGGMAQVPLPADRVRALIADLGEPLAVAAVNSPAATVVSGPPAALDRLLDHCAGAGLRARRIPVDYASHSAAVEPLRADLLGAIDGITPRRPRTPVHSTVTGGVLGAADLGAEYWYANLRETVAFGPAVRALAAADHGLFIEMSPHPVLTTAVEETAEHLAAEAEAPGPGAGAGPRSGAAGPRRPVAVGSLRRDDGGWPRFAAALAEAHCHGAAVDWAAAHAGRPGEPVDLPTYAFQRTRYWLPPAPPARAGGDAGTAAPAPAPAEARFWAAVHDGDAGTLAAALGAEPDLLRAVLPGLARWHRDQRERAAVDALCYREHWRALPDAPAPAPAGTWLVLLPPGAAPGARAWADALAAAGAATAVAEADPLGDPAALAALLRAAAAGAIGTDGGVGGAGAAGAGRLAGVLCLLTWPGPASSPTAPDAGGPAALAALLRAAEEAGTVAPLWCATEGAVSTGPGDPLRTPAQALVWGLGRVAAQEHPALWGGLVDLPPRPDRRTAALLARALTAPGGEDQLAVRPRGLHARRLVRAPAQSAAPADPAGAHRPTIPPGTVLVTGGTGALGAHTARWLARTGPTGLHLLLAGRRGAAAPGAAGLAAELTGLGARVTLAACDVADRADLARLLAGIPAADPLRAVVHTAAALDDAPLADLDRPRIAAALAAKAAGAWHLHDLTAEADLSAFVLFSSVAGTLGVAGQGNYAPANAYLDALARHRRAGGLCAASVAWGAWSAGAGLAERGGVAALLRRHGLPGMPVETATAALGRAFGRTAEPAFAVADVDWRRFTTAFTAARPTTLLDDLPEARRAAHDAVGSAPPAGTDPVADLRRRLAAASPPERERLTRALVREHAAAVLGHAAAEAVDEARSFSDLGLDSVMAVELRNRLGAATGLALPVSLAFDHPTVAAVAAHLRAGLRAAGAGPGEDPAPGAGAHPGAAELTALEALLPALDPGALRASKVPERLRALLRACEPDPPARAAADISLEDATPDEVFALIDDELDDRRT
ncbi:type I polyketide synthase [Streptomonospora mangrovi]|uniref:type I polyketide synthase n=1 Tax=Streptomonospora mangrovi TaxID=2883123 RepID=UPI0022DE3596|nr:type I polyketide synthase [Streptomonospora mangrovi]